MENERKKSANDSDDLIFEAFSDINAETPFPTPRIEEGKRLSVESGLVFSSRPESFEKKSLSDENLRVRSATTNNSNGSNEP